MENISETAKAIAGIGLGEWAFIAVIALFLYGACRKQNLLSIAYFFLFIPCLVLIWIGEFKASGILFLAGAVAIPLGQQLLKSKPAASGITVTIEKIDSDGNSSGRQKRARGFPPDFAAPNPISKERIHDAIKDGEVLSIRYYGEMSDGSSRPIIPRVINGNKLHARCINSETEKTYFISKMEEDI